MSLLQLPDQPDVSWARLIPGAGEGGSAAYQIDASGLEIYNRMMYRPLIPNGGSPAMKTRIRLKSTLQANNPAFEGIAVRHRGFRLTGSVPSRTDTQVWDSDPSSKGKRAWYSQQSGTYTDAVFIEPVPEGLGIDYITFELIVRASSGQVTISSVECRNHYEVLHNLDIPGEQNWTSGFSNEVIQQGIGVDEPVVRWVRYIKTAQIKIRKGQLVTAFLNGAMRGRAYEIRYPSTAQRMPANLGMMIKMRRVDDNTKYVYATVGFDSITGDSGDNNKTVSLESSVQFRARYDYSQIEVLPYVEPGAISEGFDERGVDIMGIRDIELEVSVAEYLTATQS